MQALSQSSFLQALGYAIANSFWQVALLWLIAIIINASFKLSAHNRYRVAITAQLSGFAWFIITLQFYYQQCTRAAVDAQLLLENNTIIYQPDVVNDKYNVLSYIAKAEMLLPYLSLAYLCLLGVLAVRWMKSYRYTSQLKNEGLQKAGMDLRLFVQDMAVQLGIKHKVKVYLSTLVNCPLTIGFLKPIILVPVATINHLTTQQLEAVLLHELAHIRRADYLINLLLNVIETILFFNPFTRLIGQIVTKEREHCCDDWVLQFKYNAPMYAEALLRIACLQASPVIAMKAEGRNEGELLWRVKRLLNQKQKRFNYSQQMVAFVVTTCLLISTAWLQPAKTVKQPQEAASSKPVKAVVVAPMAVQINNPFFNPLAFIAQPLKEKVQKATEQLTKTDLHEAVNTGLQEAGEALTAVAPAAMQELKDVNNDSDFEQAAADAKKELKKIKWHQIQKFSPLVDSMLISNAVNMAFSKDKFCIDVEKAKESLEASKLQMVRLQQQSFEKLVNQYYVNSAIENATTWITSSDVAKIWNANKNVAPAAPKKPERREKPRQQELLLRRFLENNVSPRVESFTLRLPKRKECDRSINEEQVPRDHADELANWTYTNPVYVEKASDDDSDDNQDSIYSYTSESQPEPATQSATPPTPAKPMVHVLEVTSPSQGVSIIITIREQ